MLRSRDNSIMNLSHLPIICFQKLPTMGNPNEALLQRLWEWSYRQTGIIFVENSFFSVIFKQVIELFWSDHVLSINCARYFANGI